MTRQDVEALVNGILARIGLGQEYRMPERSDDTAAPHVEGDSCPFTRVVAERGCELERRTGLDGAEIAYLLIRDLTRNHATRAEARARGKGPGSRATWMDHHVRLMQKADPGWGRRVRTRHDDTLARHSPTEAEIAAARRLGMPGEV